MSEVRAASGRLKAGRRIVLPSGLRVLIEKVRDDFPWIASGEQDFIVDAVRRRVEFLLSQER